MNKHNTFGHGFGINPGKVVWIHNPNCMVWKSNNKYWWTLDNFKEEKIDEMLKEGLLSLTGSSNIVEAWDKIFKYHNNLYKKNQGCKIGEKLVIKVNMNGSGEFSDDYSGLSKMDYTNPVLLKVLLKSLIENTNLKPEDITVLDAARIFPDYFVDYCTQDKLKGVRFEGRNESKPDLNVPLIWSSEFIGETSYFPTSVTEANYMINLASLKGHFWGVTLLAKNHFGTIINKNRFMPPVDAGLHSFVLNQKYNNYSALTDLLFNYQLGGKTILYGFDAIISTQTEGTNITKNNSKWYMDPFKGDQTKSLFLSQDPIALDSVGIDFLTNEPTIIKNNSAPINRDVDNYLHEAAQNNVSPSGTKYLNGNREEPIVFGVHEHWDNVSSKKYSKNLGANEGIDLEYIRLN